MLYPVCVHILGIAITGASDISTDLASSNQITDYSFVTQPFTLDPFNVILRCATGLGPSGSDSNTILGGWYFNGAQLFAPSGDTFCEGIVFEVRGANSRRHPGVINLYLRGTFATTEEGVYSCIMMNSSMMNQTMRVGVYFSRRSKSLDMYSTAQLQGNVRTHLKRVQDASMQAQNLVIKLQQDIRECHAPFSPDGARPERV